MTFTTRMEKSINYATIIKAQMFDNNISGCNDSELSAYNPSGVKCL